MKDKTRNILVTMIVFYIVILISLLILIFPSGILIIRESLFQNYDAEKIMMLLVCIISCLTALVGVLYSIYNRKKNREEEFIKAFYMDDERSYLERQIIELNNKIVSTEARWKDAYHLIMSSQEKQGELSGKISPTSFLKGFGIDIKDIEIQKDLAFVLTPFHEDFFRTYDIICNTCKEMKIKAIRGDEEYIANDILKHVIQYVVKARVIIAILDGRNPNVFYELGIAHSLSKPTILLASKQTTIPFDLQNQFLILYEGEKDLKDKLRNALLSILTSN